MTIRFLRDLDAPFRPAPGARVEVYDPTYYMAYVLTEARASKGPHAGCEAWVEHFEATLAGAAASLFALSAEETPEQADVGALFAEKAHLSCD